MQQTKRKLTGNSRDMTSFSWYSPSALPHRGGTDYAVDQSQRNTVFVNALDNLGQTDEIDFEPAILLMDQPRDQSIRINRIKLEATITPMDSCTEDGKPSNFPAILKWCLYPLKTPSTIPTTCIEGLGPITQPNNVALTWDFGYNVRDQGWRYTDVIDFGVVAINPHQQWGAQSIRIDPPVYEVNTTTEAGVTEGLYTPIPPTNALQFLGWYGGDHTVGKISIDKTFTDFVLEKNSLIVLEYLLYCEREPCVWFIQNISEFPRAAVKINGCCMTDYSVN